MKQILSILIILISTHLTFAQTTFIPDPNFEQALIDLGYDTGTPDGNIPTANIESITYLDVAVKNISDLTGIEDFTALTTLYAFHNTLTEIDVTQNINLLEIHCYSNEISTLDLSQNINLTTLYCNENLLENLDVSQNTNLISLNCGGNALTSLDISLNPNLDLLSCYANELVSLDLSLNPKLRDVNCSYNNLNCLNAKNGQDTIFIFTALGNPNLTCITVDDVTLSTDNWDIDATCSFSINCNDDCSTTPCNNSANYTFISNGNANYSFTNSSIGNNNTYYWAFGDGTTSTTTSPNHTFNSNGTFVVALTINDSTTTSPCIDYYINTIVVTDAPNPLQCTSGFVIYPDTMSGDVIVFNSSTGDNLTYLWNFGDGNISPLQNPNHTYTTAGPHNLCLTVDDGNGCIDQYCDSIGVNGVLFNKMAGFSINVISEFITTGINNNIDLNSEIEIYPSPAINQITINGSPGELKEIVIYNSIGQDITNLTKQINNNKSEIIIDLSNLKTGMYYVKTKTTTNKVYKQ